MTEVRATETIKFAICDDEPAAGELSGYLARYMEEERTAPYCVSSFPDGRSMLEDSEGFDVVFLDVRMGPPDRMETARLLRGRGDRSMLVFVTVLEECVFDAFEVEAYDYLVKPLDGGRFRRTMDRVFKALGRRKAAGIASEVSPAQAVNWDGGGSWPKWKMSCAGRTTTCTAETIPCFPKAKHGFARYII